MLGPVVPASEPAEAGGEVASVMLPPPKIVAHRLTLETAILDWNNLRGK